ncbi:MAG: serine hydroxymethyltransferase [Planctomycetota bacterium]|nr:MAG: serine hydroxymethyltransferase [Planctomycetota bacterium]
MHRYPQAILGELATVDAEVEAALAAELRRQEETLILIASENTASPAVMAATGSWFTNKYAEGYPGRRYYAGCAHLDVCERLARERAKELFGAEHANVQPHSGTQANLEVYGAVLEPGDTILSMSLDHGGHLSHGHPVNFVGRLYRIVNYGVRRGDGRIDMDQVAALAREHRPRMIVCGASAYSRTIDFEAFAAVAREVEAYLLCDIAHIAGLVAAGLHPSPVPHADFVTTTTHKTLRGPRGGLILCKKKHRKALNKSVFPGQQGGPLGHVIAAKAVAFREAQGEEFRAYQERIVRTAARLAERLAAKGYRIVSGGTDNHLFLVDVTAKGHGGKEAEEVLDAVGITVNKNMIPYDERTPVDPSGIRLGTPTLASRGMDVEAMDQVADLIDRALAAKDDEAARARVAAEVRALCSAYPLLR